MNWYPNLRLLAIFKEGKMALETQKIQKTVLLLLLLYSRYIF